MKAIGEEIRNIVAEVYEKLASISAEKASYQDVPDSWSKQEILGHLIDSAVNNHQRFVRACYNDAVNFPTYSQTDWVRVQQYNNSEWDVFVDLWVVYNRHLSNVIGRIPQEAMSSLVNIGRDEPVTLEYVVKDYLRHLQHHLDDILG